MSFMAEHFTGAVRAEMLSTPTTESLLSVYAVTFDAGAHTHWHTHPKGQGLYVTEGIALVQVDGQEPLRLGPGESVRIEADQRHWHGAALEQRMTHVAYQQAAEDLTTIDWHEPVTTYEFAAKENR